jgi:hypothetical protein
MSPKFLEVRNGEYINPAHIVKFKLIRDIHEPKTSITAIEFQIVIGPPIMMDVADWEKTKEKLKASDIVF